MFSNTCFLIAFLVLFTFELANCYYPMFYLYTRTNPSSPVIVDETNIKNSPFSTLRKTYLVIHGWNGAGNNDWILKIKDNLLAKENANVLAVDWSEGSSGYYYPNQASSVVTCGTRVGDFLFKAAVPASTIHCIGHSLGAHVCGYAGKRYKLGRITGMDPAGPGFRGQTSNNRLDKSDATYVDIIHTDSTFGIQEQIGHKDFYPNGGASQAGCSLIGKKDIEGVSEKGEFIVSWASCSHSRVTVLFAETILSTCKFTSVPCNSYDDFKNNRCACSSLGCPSMGFNSNLNSQQGKFFLNTNGKEPFCMN